MTTTEDRLRRDLPSLADALLESGRSRPPSKVLEDEAAGRRSTASSTTLARVGPSPVLLGAVAVVLVLLVGLAVWPNGRDPSTVGTADRSEAPDGFGTWAAVPQAPASARAFPIAAWTGTEAVFWAGSNLDRNVAYTEAVAYDPVRQTWREVDQPGWGHPGAVGTTFDGELFVVAKGSGSRLDFDRGRWVELPQVDGMFFSAVVASDDAIWGLGPSLGPLEDQPDVAIARYDPDDDAWVHGPVFEGTDATARTVDAVRDIDDPVVWTGEDIVVWDGQAGIAFRPSQQAWSVVPELRHPSAQIVDSHAVSGGDGLTVVAELRDGDSRTTGVARFEGGQWSWSASTLPPIDLDTATVAAAEAWIVLLLADAPPITVHGASGAWKQHPEAPLRSVQAPGTVWSGEQLIVWGGVHLEGATSEAGTGMVWTPPTGR